MLYRAFFAGTALILVSLAMGGCPQQTQQTFTAELTGAKEVPPVESEGEGEGTFTLNTSARELTFDVSAAGLSGPVTVAHFHLGPPDEAGPIVFDLTSFVEETNGDITLNGVWELTEVDLNNLLDGQIYINLHTAQNPAGEIRGQLELQE